LPGVKEVSVKTLIFMTLILVILLSSFPAFGQRVVEPGELKISPNKYKNASIKLEDRFILNRSGIPASLTASGYTLNKYIAFGLSGAGMRCFVRRSAAMEQLIGELKKGEQITVIGTVKQPKAKRKTAGGRKIETVKLDIYIIEASKIVKGWGE
jgi:hypothetical protein